MNRRQLLKGCVGLVAMANLQHTFAADGTVEYSREAYEEALASGKPFMLDFHATW